MKMGKQLIAIALLSTLSACTLDEVKDRGQRCPTEDSENSTISYIVMGQNQVCRAGTACAQESEAFSESFRLSVCPLAYPTCKKNETENAWYCMEKCADGLVACDGQCIESDSNPKYCGADAACLKYTVCKDYETCKDGKCINMGCTEGEYQCSGQKLQKCEQGSWHTEEDCPKVKKCDLEKRSCEDLLCIDNTYVCNENELLRCWNETYEHKETCDDSHFCDELTGTCMEKVCQSGQTMCGNEQNVGKLKICQNNAWSPEVTSCQNDVSCAGDECGECQNYDTKCEDKDGIGYQSRCVEGKWSTGVKCEGDASCNGKVCGACAENALICASTEEATGTVIKKCVGGEYQIIQECGNVSCHENACGACLNYSTKCDNIQVGNNENVGVIKTCIEGEWDTGLKCENQYSCAGDVCGACIEGDVTCAETKEGAVVKRCENGVYRIVQECAGVSCNNNQCGQCMNFDTKCEELNDKGAESSCRNGVWSEPLPCANNASCNGNKCGDCTNSNHYCEGMTGVGQNHVCISGKWGEAADCENSASCTVDSICGTCLTDSKLCTPGNNGKKAVLSNCSNGVWKEIQECGTEECQSAQECATCSTGAKLCVNENGIGKMKNCVAGSWVEDSCGAVSCNNSSEPNGDKCGSCKNDESSCRNVGDFGKLTKCVNGEMKESDCPNSAKCFHADENGNATDCGFCLEKDVKCENNENNIGVLSTCTEGDWIPGICKDNTSCDPATNRCGVCHNGDVKCENNESGIGVVSTCINGNWSQSPCEAVSCSGNACGTCLNDATKCDNTEGKGQLATCVAGELVVNDCPDNTACKDAIHCMDCQPGTVKCTNDPVTNAGTLMSCEGGAWKVTSCYASCKDATTCGECTNGETQCTLDSSFQGYLKTCTSAVWPTTKTSCGEMSEYPYSAIRCYGQECDHTQAPAGNKVTLMLSSAIKPLETLPEKCDEASLPMRPEIKLPALTTGYEYVIEPEIWNIQTTYIEALAESTTAGINNAISWAKNKGYSRIVLPAGTYAITSAGIKIPGDTAFILSDETTLQMVPQTDSNYKVLSLNGNNIFVQGGQILGENQTRSEYGSGGGSGALVMLAANISQIHIDNVKLAYGASSAIKGSKVTHLTVSNCEITRNRFSALYVSGANHRYSGNTIHTNFVANGNTDSKYGINLMADNVIVDNNILYNNIDGDINLYNSSLFIENNLFRTFNVDGYKQNNGTLVINGSAKSNIVLYKNVLNRANSWHYFGTQFYHNLGSNTFLDGPYFYIGNIVNGGAFYVSKVTNACVTENVLNNAPFAISTTTSLRLFNNTANKDEGRYNFKNAKGKAWDNKACKTDGSSCVTGHTFEETLNDDTESTIGNQNYF